VFTAAVAEKLKVMNLWNKSSWAAGIKAYPMVALIMLGAILGAFVTEFSPSITRILFFADPESGQYYRLLTPVFLHFGLLHLVFNSLWLSILGSRIESIEGSIHLLILIVISGICSNLAQYYWSNSIYFGGLSGVIYALLGYIWVKSKISPDKYPALPNGLMGFMVGWLLLCMTGILEIAVGIGVANAAHLGGLIIGLLIGLAFALMGKSKTG
jgi:membrane associated rhomboid family serine protease